MISNMVFKNTALFLVLSILSCGNSFNTKARSEKPKAQDTIKSSKSSTAIAEIKTGADDWITYLPVLKKHKNIGIVANQTSIVNYNPNAKNRDEFRTEPATKSMHLVDCLV